MFDPTGFFLLFFHLPAKEEPSWSSGLPTGFQEAVTRTSSHSPPLSTYCFWICQRTCWDERLLFFILFYFFFGQVWCWMEAAALFRIWWGRKTQLRVNTLLVFSHKYEIVQEHQIHMEHCDWLLLMSYWCHSTQMNEQISFPYLFVQILFHSSTFLGFYCTSQVMEDI